MLSAASSGRFPYQLVLYVGRGPMRMQRLLTGPHGPYQCPMMDIRELDTATLLNSVSLEDNVIAVLTRSGSNVEAVRKILARISKAAIEDQGRALIELTFL